MNSSGATCQHRGASRQPLVLQLQTLNSGFTDSANSGITDPVSVGAASDGTVQLQSGTSLNSANSEACCFIHSLAHPNLLNDAATAEAAPALAAAPAVAPAAAPPPQQPPPQPPQPQLPQQPHTATPDQATELVGHIDSIHRSNEPVYNYPPPQPQWHQLQLALLLEEPQQPILFVQKRQHTPCMRCRDPHNPALNLCCSNSPVIKWK